jgi:hypothetical protein
VDVLVEFGPSGRRNGVVKGEVVLLVEGCPTDTNSLLLAAAAAAAAASSSAPSPAAAAAVQQEADAAAASTRAGERGALFTHGCSACVDCSSQHLAVTSAVRLQSRDLHHRLMLAWCTQQLASFNSADVC